MPDIFISYKRENQPFAETLRENLLGWGYSVWMDVYDIPPGAHWPDAIDAGINDAHTVIGVLSPEAVQSRNVKNEWDWAIVNERRLLLIMLEDCTVPVNYVSINYIDATADHDTALARLRAALEIPADPPAACDDPYLPYLQALYERINTVLAQAIIKLDDQREPEPIPLISQRTRGAVDALFEAQDRQIDPLFAVRGLASDQPEWEVGDFHAVFEHFDGRVLLLGEPGAGKTITLLHFGRDAVVQRIQNRAAPLPILALIPTWNASEQPPIIEWIAASYGAPENARQVIKNGRALLLLDGLDELGGEREEQDPDHPDDPEQRIRYDPRQRFITALARAPKIQMIVTCREKDYESIDAKIALNGAVTLQPLSDGQMRAYLDTLPDLWAALQADAGLRDIARTPLLLSFFAFAYREMTGEDVAKLRDLRESPGGLRDTIFERYVHERYEHEARRLAQIGAEMLFSLEEINTVLGEVAMRNARGGWRVEDNILPQQDFADMLNRIGWQDRVPDFLALSLHLNLIARGERDAWRFIHLLLRDYFGFNYAIPCLTDAEPGVRDSAAETLGRIGDARAVEPLAAALRDDDEYVHRRAADALGEIGAPAVAVLVAALRDDDRDVRGSAAETLGQIRDARAVEPLIAALRDDHDYVRWEAAIALGQIGDRCAVEPLMVALRDDDWDMRWRAAIALGEIRDARAVEPLIIALRDDDRDVRGSAADALGKIGDERAVEPLIAALRDDDWDMRRRAAIALGKIGDARAVNPLIRALADTEQPRFIAIGICHIAAHVLTEIGTPEALAAVEAWRAKPKSVIGRLWKKIRG